MRIGPGGDRAIAGWEMRTGEIWGVQNGTLTIDAPLAGKTSWGYTQLDSRLFSV